MSLYDHTDTKTVIDLNNDKTTTKHDLMQSFEIQNSIHHSVFENNLAVVFTTPTGVINPTYKDIDSIYLVDHAHVILAHASLAGTIIGEAAFITNNHNKDIFMYQDIYDLTQQLMATFTEETYYVVVESMRYAEVNSHRIEVMAYHPLQAIAIAIRQVAEEVYEDTPESWGVDAFDVALECCLSAGENAVLSLASDKRYAVLSVSRAADTEIPTCRAQAQAQEQTISFKVPIDLLLAMPNLMDCITTDEGITESQVREWLIKWKKEGLEFVPL